MGGRIERLLPYCRTGRARHKPLQSLPQDHREKCAGKALAQRQQVWGCDLRPYDMDRLGFSPRLAARKHVRLP
jgi:hypothetical protein